MATPLPKKYEDYKDWGWAEIGPHFEALLNRDVNEDTVIEWLTDWVNLYALVSESYGRRQIATTVDTTDKVAEERLMDFAENVIEKAQAEDQKLKEKFLATGLEPQGFEISLRNMRVDAEIFREANLPLATQEHKLGIEYDQIIGAQMVEWEGEEKTLPQMNQYLLQPDRDVRERAFRAIMERTLQDREKLNDLWGRFLDLRQTIAENAGFDNFRDYQWKAFHRFDYTPEDCEKFHQAIEETVVPAVQRLYEHKKRQLGLDALRPWDLDVDPENKPPLKPFETIDQLNSTVSQIFYAVDKRVGGYFDIMQAEKLLDLDSRKGKAPGGYCAYLPVSKRAFIFMNAVGTHDDVQTMLHEGGHAFHGFEFVTLPDYQQTDNLPIEFAEVASMSMELLASPYLAKDKGGFYSEADASRAVVEHLEKNLRFWPYMAVVDAFQHWVYTHIEEAKNADNCDRKWSELWDRFMPGIDYSGLEDVKATGWHRKLHIFQIPFYYVEYGIAQLGASQVWRNALEDQSKAVNQYLHALSLGGTVSLPKLFEAAGAKLAMDSTIVGEMVELHEKKLAELQA